VTKSSRRGFLAVLGTGLAALTGAAARPSDCAAVTGSESDDCGEALSLGGPQSVDPSASNPRFVATNDGSKPVDVHTGEWSVYRRDDGWEEVAGNAGSGTVSLGSGEQTAWVLLFGGDDGGGGMTTMSTTTRYVGPVSLPPGSYAFVVAGERGGSSVSAAARFDVTE